jgi:hypothetical protein
MNLRKYFWRGSIFGTAGVISAILELAFLYLLTQLGLWYMWAAIVGHIIGGIVLYNLNIASGNIKIAGKVLIGPVCQHPGCTAKAEIPCPCGKVLCPEHYTLHQ